MLPSPPRVSADSVEHYVARPPVFAWRHARSRSGNAALTPKVFPVRSAALRNTAREPGDSGRGVERGSGLLTRGGTRAGLHLVSPPSAAGIHSSPCQALVTGARDPDGSAERGGGASTPLGSLRYLVRDSRHIHDVSHGETRRGGSRA